MTGIEAMAFAMGILQLLQGEVGQLEGNSEFQNIKKKLTEIIQRLQILKPVVQDAEQTIHDLSINLTDHDADVKAMLESLAGKIDGIEPVFTFSSEESLSRKAVEVLMRLVYLTPDSAPDNRTNNVENIAELTGYDLKDVEIAFTELRVNGYAKRAGRKHIMAIDEGIRYAMKHRKN